MIEIQWIGKTEYYLYIFCEYKPDANIARKK